MRAPLALAALLLAAAPLPATPLAAPNIATIRGPQWFQDSLIYFNDFEAATNAPEVNSEHLTTAPQPWQTAAGFFGRGLQTDNAPTLVLQGAALSPHRPLTLSFWWALPRDLAIDGGFGLFSLNGRGFISAFSRGRGEWCALKQPAGVCQVYNFPGIQNVNGIYDFDLLRTLNLHAGVWHHSAAVLRRSNVFQFYTDGKLVSEITLSGREWSAADGVNSLTLGGGVVLDDVAVLGRAIDGDFIADYERGLRQLREYR